MPAAGYCRSATNELCLVSDCFERRRASNGYCAKHYVRWRNYGDPLYTARRTEGSSWHKIDDTTAAIELTKGYEALVDLEDAPRIARFAWQANEQKQYNYVRAIRTVNNTAIYMHHEVLQVMPWELNGDEIDHIDRNPLNNRKINLDRTSHEINMQNSKRSIERVGICFNRRANLWMAYNDSVRARKYLGYRKTEQEARELLQSALKCE
jgi:hypothetical protein